MNWCVRKIAEIFSVRKWKKQILIDKPEKKARKKNLPIWYYPSSRPLSQRHLIIFYAQTQGLELLQIHTVKKNIIRMNTCEVLLATTDHHHKFIFYFNTSAIFRMRQFNLNFHLPLVFSSNFPFSFYSIIKLYQAILTSFIRKKTKIQNLLICM